MISLCLFGAGRIARVHAANIAAHTELAMRTVVDPDLDGRWPGRSGPAPPPMPTRRWPIPRCTRC